jgi:hypothetical protein
MFSETPGTPGRRQQMPRTARRIGTPADERPIQRTDRRRVDERVQFRDDRRRLPGPRLFGFAVDEPEDLLV